MQHPRSSLRVKHLLGRFARHDQIRVERSECMRCAHRSRSRPTCVGTMRGPSRRCSAQTGRACPCSALHEHPSPEAVTAPPPRSGADAALARHWLQHVSHAGGRYDTLARLRYAFPTGHERIAPNPCKTCPLRSPHRCVRYQRPSLVAGVGERGGGADRRSDRDTTSCAGSSCARGCRCPPWSR